MTDSIRFNVAFEYNKAWAEVKTKPRKKQK